MRIAKEYFMESQSCERCHSDIYKQWQSSMHHFSSFNNQWYRKSIEYMQDTIGIKPSRWCAGCHDPSLLFSGEFDKPIREVENTPAGQAGLGCMMCHSITGVKSTMGQGDYRLEVPALHDMAMSENPIGAAFPRFFGGIESGAAPADFLEAVHAHANGGFLLDVPQSASRYSGESLSLDARIQ